MEGRGGGREGGRGGGGDVIVGDLAGHAFAAGARLEEGGEEGGPG